MRAVWCGLATGIWILQQQAALPSLTWRVALAVCAVGGVASLGLKRTGRFVGALRSVMLFAAACTAGIVFAAWRADLRLADALPSSLEGRDLLVSGVTTGLPETSARGMRFVLTLDDACRTRWHLPQRVSMHWDRSVARSVPLRPGQRWRLAVRLIRPHGDANFHAADGEAHLFERGIRARGQVRARPAPVLLDATVDGLPYRIDRAREAARQRMRDVLGDRPHAGVVIALAVGAQASIDPRDWQRFSRTGTNHLVAISGLHISLAAGFASAFAAWLWRRSFFTRWQLPLRMPAQHVASLAGVAAGAAFAALAGWGVPAQRAWWMQVVVALAALTGRKADASYVLAWALGLVLLADPWAVLAPGFWLSFGAVAAIVAVDASWGRRVPACAPSTHGNDDIHADPVATPWRRRLAAWLRARWHAWAAGARRASRAQYAVTLALAPPGILWFSQVPLTGPLANALAIPWVSLLVVPAVLAGVVLPAPLDAGALRLAHALLDPLCAWLDWLARPAWTLWHAPAPDGWALALALGGILWRFAPRGWPLRGAAWLLWLPLLCARPGALRQGEFRVTALDVGQGAAAVIETATHRLVYDTGPRYGGGTDAGARIVVPFLRATGIDRLDVLMLSHGDADHAGGAAALLAALPVASLRASLAPGDTLWRTARETGVAAAACGAGDRWTWDGIDFAVLWPAPSVRRDGKNAASCVLRAGNGTHSVLLTGDIGAAQERALLARARCDLRATVLFAPHHGSRTSSSPGFVTAAGAREVVFQAGYRSRFGHPHALVTRRYLAAGATLHRSDRDGAVRFASRAGVLAVERFRASHHRYWMGR